jgi:hypothetical protein
MFTRASSVSFCLLVDYFSHSSDTHCMTHTAADDFREKQYDVLVSYQRADDDQRRELVVALEARGYDVFWDGKLGPDYWRVEWRNRPPSQN